MVLLGIDAERERALQTNARRLQGGYSRGGSLMVACDQHPLNRETPSHPSWPAGTEARQSHRLKVKVWRAGLPSPPSSGRQEVDTRMRGRHCPAASRVR